MPTSRGMYRSRHPAACRPSDAGRNDYVESPAKLARAFEEALERNRQRLDEQREEIRRSAAVRHAPKRPCDGWQKQRFCSRPASLCLGLPILFSSLQHRSNSIKEERLRSVKKSARFLLVSQTRFSGQKKELRRSISNTAAIASPILTAITTQVWVDKLRV
jgi:hypothetical protein